MDPAPPSDTAPPGVVVSLPPDRGSHDNHVRTGMAEWEGTAFRYQRYTFDIAPTMDLPEKVLNPLHDTVNTLESKAGSTGYSSRELNISLINMG